MQISLNPGFVYIFFSVNRPTDVKIGKALNAEDREFQLSLADPDLKLYRSEFFMDVFSAENHMHSIFKDKRINRADSSSTSEHFKVSRKMAGMELDKLVESRRQERLEFDNHCRYMADVGALKLDSSLAVEECSGTALSVLLSSVPSPRDGRNVKQLVAQALSGGSLSPAATRLLSRIGLMTFAVEGIVLLDKSKDTVLEKLFKGKQCAKTWREQLKKFAGINESGRVVGLNAWMDITEAGPELVDRVSPGYV